MQYIELLVFRPLHIDHESEFDVNFRRHARRDLNDLRQLF